MTDHKVTPVLIHGANSTSSSFKYIIEKLDLDNLIVMDYKSDRGFQNNLTSMIQICKPKKNLFFIGHSLGGVYSAHLSQKTQSVGGISIATPYGGSSVANCLRWALPSVQLFHDIRTTSQYITCMKQFKFHKNWTQVVTTSGNTIMLRQPNDGVVSRRSMTALGDKLNYKYLPYNHFEVKMSDELVSLIKEKMSCAGA